MAQNIIKKRGNKTYLKMISIHYATFFALQRCQRFEGQIGDKKYNIVFTKTCSVKRQSLNYTPYIFFSVLSTE
ncbi:hypothetical protein JM83_2687 [Gillisia sp. Hel_I_86]|nr:hypothetical protein JM83_2687 [Gillisia sp. Hel_I_86]